MPTAVNSVSSFLNSSPRRPRGNPMLRNSMTRAYTSPHYLKHWKFFGKTKDFLRERYAKYHILQGPTLTFDCLIRKYQRRIFNKSYQDEHGDPAFYEVKDSYEWYERAIRMDIFDWQVGFSCRSNLCQRDWCFLHRRNPQKIYPVDIYSLISVFEGISVAVAKSHVAKWFGLKLGELESKGVRATNATAAESLQEGTTGRDLSATRTCGSSMWIR